MHAWGTCKMTTNWFAKCSVKRSLVSVQKRKQTAFIQHILSLSHLFFPFFWLVAIKARFNKKGEKFATLSYNSDYFSSSLLHIFSDSLVDSQVQRVHWGLKWQKRGFSPFMEAFSLSGMMLVTMLLTGGRKIKRKFQWNVYYLHFLFLKHEQKC